MPLKILMIGPSLASPGGMTSVANLFCASAREDVDISISYLSSYERPGLFTQLRVMAHALWTLLLNLLRRRVDLVHVHSASRGSFHRKAVICLLARLAGIPYIFHIHSGEFPIFVRDECGSLAKRWVETTLNHAVRVVCLTNSWQHDLAHLFPQAPLATLVNPIEVPTAADLPHEREPMVLFLGRLREKKGVFDLVDAMVPVLQAAPGTRFVLAGDGDAEAVRQHARLRGVEGQLDLPGWIDGAQKIDLLHRARVLVLPSYFEGLPMCILEAMACKTCVVATQVGGIPEVLEHGKCGLMIPPGKPELLGRAISHVLLNDNLRVSMTTHAYDRVSLNYARDVVWLRLKQMYALTASR